MKVNYCKELAKLNTIAKDGYRTLMVACRIADIYARLGDDIYFKKGEVIYEDTIEWINDNGFRTAMSGTEIDFDDEYYNSLDEVQSNYEIVEGGVVEHCRTFHIKEVI